MLSDWLNGDPGKETVGGASDLKESKKNKECAKRNGNKEPRIPSISDSSLVKERGNKNPISGHIPSRKDRENNK